MKVCGFVSLRPPSGAEWGCGATFATKLPSQCSGTRADSHGKFYQWGINVAWNTTTSSASGATPSGSWNTSTYPSNWNTHPCPDGYRLPTKDEFQTLINSSTVSRGGGWSSSDYGYIKFTSGSNSVEFPAVGLRDYSDGSLYDAGTYGRYWSSVAYGSGSAYYLYFLSSNLYVNYDGKQYGRSVRCVR
ncbi:MAG: fibrobacter succinogenes major paralogous domain-containing protein [Rikenellaceae bacterium]|nr:fibrobacter succinogenes major paralogous domain-containing protein [Rikenellaceae bacterium]